MGDYIGQILGKYRLMSLLGKGSFADVYLGKHIYLKHEVAVKVLYGRLDSEAVEHFLTEARHLRQLDHPHIVQIYDVGIEGETPFLIMDYAAGGTLRRLHGKGERIPLSRVVAYVQQIAAGLDYAHEQKLIHRDLKPENLLIGYEDRVLLSDFGVAVPMRSTDAMSMQGIGGTLAYMAPEQIKGKPKAASDQYALAVMVYEWLSGRRPFQGAAAELCGQHLFVDPPSLFAISPDIQKPVEDVVFKGLAKEPTARFETVRAFADALEAAPASREPSTFFFMKAPEAASVIETPRGLFQEPVRKHMSKLPAQVTSLIGRNAERTAACVLLVRPEVRLLTMTGPGGIGKTQLSLSIANDLQHAFRDGAAFVPLAAISDPDLVLSAILQTLEIREVPGLSQLASLKAVLGRLHMLLVLDNFEQVLDAAPALLDILQSCHDLTMLVTSRAVLHVPGEQVFPIPPLELPSLKDLASKEKLEQYASVALFVQRAQAIKRDFQLTDANCRAIAEICVKLDGLPLAIELAAARVKLLPPQVLLTRLGRRLDVLTGTSKATTLRQQTVRNTIQWSYDLLTVSEKRLFQRLAAFVGGCLLSDVEALYEMLEDDPITVMDEVDSLLDKSLIFQVEQAEGEPRLLMLETIREYGGEMLEKSGERERVRAAHAAYYQTFIPEVEPIELGWPLLGAWVQRLKAQYENVRAALNYLLEQRETEKALELATGMGAIWYLGGYGSEGVNFLEEILAVSKQHETSESSRARATTTYVAGRVAIWIPGNRSTVLIPEAIKMFRALGDRLSVCIATNSLSYAVNDLGECERADELHEEAIQMMRKLRFRKGMPRILIRQMLVVFYRGDFKQVQALNEECLPIARESKDGWIIACALHLVSWSYYIQGAYAAAVRLEEEAVGLYREMEFPPHGVEAVCVLGYEVAALGDEARAESLFKESLALSRELADPMGIARALSALGWLALRQGNREKARALLEESIQVTQEVRQVVTRERYIPASSLERCAEIAVAEGQNEWATRLLGAAETWRTVISYYLPVGREHPYYDRTQAAVRSSLGEARYNSLLIEGRKMSLQQVMSAQGPGEIFLAGIQPASGQQEPFAKKVFSIVLESANNTETMDGNYTEGLTKRELDVLRSLSRGKTNAEIAEELILSIVTVNSYLRSIYSKLGVSSRTQAMRIALDAHMV